jgi:hypothetical protein
MISHPPVRHYRCLKPFKSQLSILRDNSEVIARELVSDTNLAATNADNCPDACRYSTSAREAVTNTYLFSDLQVFGK